MSLFRHVPMQLVADLNRLNGAVATVNDLVFDQVRPTTEDEKALKGRDSTARLLGQGHKYFGVTQIYYNRLKLETAFANQLIKLTFLKPFTSLYDQFEVINEEFASVFTKDDLEDVTIEPSEEEFGVLTLTAKPQSLGWQGSVQIAYEVIDPVNVDIPDTELDGYMTPNERIDVTQASLLYAAYDFNIDRVWLESLQPGPLDATAIARLRDALLAKRNDIDWAVTGEALYSLSGVSLTYRGTNPDELVNKLYKQGAVFQLGTSSTAVEGQLYLHYSLEGDDDV